MAVIADRREHYMDAIKASRLFPTDGSSGIYVGDVGIFYRPLEKTDSLSFSGIIGDRRSEIYLSFPQISKLYPLLNEAGRTGIVRSIEQARRVAMDIASQRSGEAKTIAEDQERYLRDTQEHFCSLLTEDEVRMLSRD